MAQPRIIVPGASYLLTRRTHQRVLRLRPDSLTNQIARYCIAWAAMKTGVLIHSLVIMSNHEHLTVTDPNALLPDFIREAHRAMAKAMNAAQGQWENLWAVKPTGVTLLPTVDDVVDKIAYTAANPVEAGLVEVPEQWPGVNDWEPGKVLVVERPSLYFDPKGGSPEGVKLEIVAPPQVQGDLSDWKERIHEAVETKVKEAQAKIRSEGRAFAGESAVRRRSIRECAASFERKRELCPAVSARDGSVRKRRLAELKEFRRSYRAAKLEWTQGNRHVAFPYGTWWMRVHHKANVLSAPP
jgi:putative transposase